MALQRFCFDTGIAAENLQPEGTRIFTAAGQLGAAGHREARIFRLPVSVEVALLWLVQGTDIPIAVAVGYW